MPDLRLTVTAQTSDVEVVRGLDPSLTIARLGKALDKALEDAVNFPHRALALVQALDVVERGARETAQPEGPALALTEANIVAVADHVFARLDRSGQPLEVAMTAKTATIEALTMAVDGGS